VTAAIAQYNDGSLAIGAGGARHLRKASERGEMEVAIALGVDP